MKLWKISQQVNNDYDTYDSAVVAAETEELAQMTYPDDYRNEPNQTWTWNDSFDSNDTWCSKDNVKVELIGTATEGTKPGVICASFNAG